jgi:hypothetical protein
MANLETLAGVTYFWLAFAANLVLLCLQVFYVDPINRPSFLVLSYRLAITVGFSLVFLYTLIRAIGPILGWYLKNGTEVRREKILNWVQEHEATKNSIEGSSGEIPKDIDWRGIIGFFHPFWYALCFGCEIY